MIDEFVAKRQLERGKKPGSTVSRASVNKDLRNLRRALRKAASWGYIARVPEIEFLKEDDKVVRFVTAEHFADIYGACGVAVMPNAQYSSADWWRALLVTGYMTGWRIDELLSLRWEDVDLESGRALLRAEDTKGKRHEELPLHQIILDHIRKLPSFGREVFAWADGYKDLWDQFHAIQEAAGIAIPCYDAREHECTPSCHRYGFHDLRRAFATQNALHLTGDALQKLMRHKSYATTQRYINVATQLHRSVEKLHVPTLPELATA
jgi:integrase